jgi:hypothetical protein
MNIKSDDVAEITEVGELYGDKVKMVKTYGGLNVLIGKKDKNSKKPDALAAASHRALAVHQLEKMYGNDFQPSIMKSESAQIEAVIEFKVSNNLNKNHLEIHSISKNNEVDFVVSRFGIILAKYECEIKQNNLKLKRYGKTDKASDTLSKNSQEITNCIKDAMVLYGNQLNIGLKI